MNTLLSNLSAGWSNQHVRWPVIAGASLSIASIWFPEYADKFNATAKILFGYGIIAAANSGPKDTSENKQPKDPSK